MDKKSFKRRIVSLTLAFTLMLTLFTFVPVPASAMGDVYSTIGAGDASEASLTIPINVTWLYENTGTGFSGVADSYSSSTEAGVRIYTYYLYNE